MPGSRRVVRLRAVVGASVLAVLASTVALTGPAHASAFDTTWDTYSSNPQGGTDVQHFTGTDVVLSGSASSARVDASPSSWVTRPPPGWRATFTAPPGEVLVAGRTYAISPTPLLGFRSDAHFLVDSPTFACTGVGGTFTVYEMEQDGVSGSPTRLSVRVDETCGDQATHLQGDIYVNARYPAATRSQLRWTTVPLSPAPLGSVVIKGELYSSLEGLGGLPITVTRHDEDGDHVTALTTDEAGRFQFPDTLPAGDVTYSARYEGDADHAAVERDLVIKAVKAPTTLAFTGPASAPPFSQLTLSGVLTDADGPVPGASIHVTAASGGTTSDLNGPVTDLSGHYSLTTQIGSEVTTFSVSFPGDLVRLGSQASTTVAVVRPPAVLTLFGPATATRGEPTTFTGYLSYGDGGPDDEVTLTRTDLAGSTTSIIATDQFGIYTLTDTPTVGGNVTYSVSWPGNALFAPAERSITVNVSRQSTDLSIRATRSTYAYGTRAKVVAHLGTTYNGRTVSIYARRLGTSAGNPGTLIANGLVNAKGDLTTYYPLTRRSTFTAVFAGDYRYLPATATVTPTLSR